MTESAALLVDDELPNEPIRQWVLSFPCELRFHRVKTPTVEELNSLVHQLSHRIARFLEKKGWLQRDAENTYLLLDALDSNDEALGQLQGHSITYRIALGPRQGRKVLSLQGLPPNP